MSVGKAQDARSKIALKRTPGAFLGPQEFPNVQSHGTIVDRKMSNGCGYVLALPALGHHRVAGEQRVAPIIGVGSTAPVPSARDAISWAMHWARKANVSVESTAYLRQVHDWRESWRPAQVRFLLVAESHVGENPGDLAVRVQLPEPVQETLPTGYCRLVYCLGYGENELCQTRPAKNFGTRQFWDLLGQIAWGIGSIQPRKAQTSASARVTWKLKTLR